MGVASPELSFLLAARWLGASYERTLTIGRQYLLVEAADVIRAYADCGLPIGGEQARCLVAEGNGYVEPMLRRLGARDPHSLDASDYEGSTFVHDLNQPLPADLRERYSLVFDGGSLEHVFNFPQALKNCMHAVERGGHLLTIAPANNYFGHGFYQLSPELFFRAFAPVNGFEIVKMLARDGRPRAHWSEVSDPAMVGGRVTMSGPWATMLYVLARRTEIVEPLTKWPQQSDYAATWAAAPSQPRSRRVRTLIPARARYAVRMARTIIGTNSDPSHFRRVEMADIAQSFTR